MTIMFCCTLVYIIAYSKTLFAVYNVQQHIILKKTIETKSIANSVRTNTWSYVILPIPAKSPAHQMVLCYIFRWLQELSNNTRT